MPRRIITVVFAGLVTAGALVVAGCSSGTTGSSRPNALTGENGSYGVNGAGTNSSLTAQERARYTDQKGRFHPEWVGQPGR
jgi:hypothetical protein